MINRLILFCFLSFLLTSCEKDVSPYPELQFEQIETVTELARASATAFSVNDKAYVLLGRTDTWNMLSDCWEFDPTDESWTRKQDFPGEKRVLPVSAAVDGFGYVGMGYNYNNGGPYREASYLKDFWQYNPADDSWVRKADFPTHTSNNMSSFVYQDEIYVLHGFGPDTFNGNMFKYNLVDDTWTQLADFPGYNRTAAVACTNGNRIFAGTGFAMWNEDDWWEYLPASDSWSRKKNMPDGGRINGLSFVAGNRFFVATGRYWAGKNTGGHVKSDVVEFDAIRNKWYHAGNIPGGGRENALCFTINGKVYIGFGENDAGILTDLWSCQP